MLLDKSEPDSSGPYPGFDKTGNYYTPRKAPRVRPEAEEFACKSKGSLELFGSGTPRYIPKTPRNETRCQTEDGRRNHDIGRNGTVSCLLNGSATPRPEPAPGPRVKPEAEEIAGHHKGKSTSELFNSYGRLPTSARKEPRVKPEATETAEKSSGGFMRNLMHEPNKIPPSSRKEPRVKPEASVTASKEGKEMMKNLQRFGTPLSSRAVPRVKPEAEEIAVQHQGGRMSSIMHKYGSNPRDVPNAPRVKPEGEEMASLDKGGRMSRLMHEGSKARRSPRPPPRATSKEAQSIVRKNRGTMQAVLSSTGGLMIVPTAGK
ncbi:uncharacterized protein LOC125659693 [Ostrea edulis]|uniref:uncharacterized protein LOC125659693 n=1 Tax=Ostrea edulis TaxID=37623 RepID=UPI0020950E45|nr:uncharacterized protein LOC125659693 [Ostrea edulis]XP_056005684.1 uncharacterized protein LOC125659693 [Ostrea edulis]